jgi:lysophospholipase L1-like esterase
VTDFSLLESANESDFAQTCEEASGRGFISAVDEIIRQASEAGMKVVFAEMPMNPDHVRRFYDTSAWEQYRAHIQKLLAADGVIYIDASHWEGQESLFGDHLHLNDAGARQFSERLGEQLRAQGSFPGL